LRVQYFIRGRNADFNFIIQTDQPGCLKTKKLKGIAEFLRITQKEKMLIGQLPGFSQ
jgi:hypothetical protein